MVAELHRMGYQKLRIFPYEYPLAWRLCVAPRAACSARNGAYVPHSAFEAFQNRCGSSLEPNPASLLPTYSSASERHYFGWPDAAGNTARDMATKFIQRFPKAAENGRGRDWEYAGWMAELVGELEGSPRLPFVMAEYFEPEPLRLRGLPIREFSPEKQGFVSMEFPLPPAGDWQQDD